MMTLLCSLGFFFLFAVLITANAVLNSKDGFEDAEGFHAISRRSNGVSASRSAKEAGSADLPPLVTSI